MILKSQKDLDDLNIDDKIYAAFAPKIEVYDSIFTFNTSAKINIYHPVFVFEKKTETDFEQFKDEIKRSYTMNIFNVIADINDYDQYNTHAYYVTTSERETLQLLNRGHHELLQTVQRSAEMVDRLVSDFNASNMMVKNKELYPEDWI